MPSGKDIVIALTQALSSKVDNPAYEARLMVMAITDRDPRLPGCETVSDEQYHEMTTMVEKRLCGEPLQYILGEWEFMGIPLKVGKGVLCPRPDSECLVEKAIELLQAECKPVVLDLCAGSGALALGIKRFVPTARILAIEKYSDAYGYLDKNVKGSGIEPIQADIEDFYKSISDNSISLIISNPPYIPYSDKKELAPELSYEPDTALFEPSDLYFYRLLAKKYHTKLKYNGNIIVEIPTFRELDVADIFKKENLMTNTVMDLNHTIRGVIGTRK